jgi:hypothetical protein
MSASVSATVEAVTSALHRLLVLSNETLGGAGVDGVFLVADVLAGADFLPVCETV